MFFTSFGSPLLRSARLVCTIRGAPNLPCLKEEGFRPFFLVWEGEGKKGQRHEDAARFSKFSFRRKRHYLTLTFFFPTM